MRTGIKKWFFIICVIVMSVACINIGYKVILNALETTNRTEAASPNEYNVSISGNSEYAKIYENNNFEYFYSTKKNILKILNKKSGFIWSTGADTEKRADQERNCSNITKYSDEYYACAIDIGSTRDGKDTSSVTYAKINGILYFTLFNQQLNPSSSTIWATTENTSVGFFGHNKYANEWMFKLSYYAQIGSNSSSSEEGENQESSESSSSSSNYFEVNINMRLTFTEDGFDLNIYDEDITGKSKYLVEAIYPLPLLGQSGGKMIRCTLDNNGNCSFNDTSTIVDNPKTNLDGYIFVPDGSGALIRFDNIKYYDSEKTAIYFDMYKDPYREVFTEKEFAKRNEVEQPSYVPTKHISMPVWGVSYGNNQDAFVAYVKKGSEYFGLLYNGRTTVNEYASIRPRFEKNRIYIYRIESKTPSYCLNESESFYYDYDINVAYNFLQGDGSNGELPANYTGMALKYRSYLEEKNLIKKNVELKTGPKVDFLMSDSKSGVFGQSEVNVTSCDDIIDIYNDLHNDGINDITSTLYGWQNKGMNVAKPSTVDYNSNAGGKSGFKKVVKVADNYDYLINFYQQYAMLTELQYSSINGYTVKALSRDYGKYLLADKSKPITWWFYTNADVAGKWLNKQAEKLSQLGDNVGISTGGISTLVIPDYGKKLTYAGAKNSIYQSTKAAANYVNLSGDTPNDFLWKNYDEYTNIPVYNSQLQCETDSVPFMEIVLSGLVNLYAEYANFSFYDKESQLKMIEYNLNPSFIITAKENEDIMYTNSRDWFSTSYESYHEIINEICSFVMPYLKLVQGKTIVNREVITNDDGSVKCYRNTYASFNDGVVGDDKVVLEFDYNNLTVKEIK